MSRPGKVVIHLAALRHNLSLVKKLAPGRRIMAVVKADAYGHGLVRVARALQAADSFGVACLEEAEQLREAGLSHPVILLEGPFAASELDRVAALGLEIVVHHEEQLHMLEQSRLPAPVSVWLKVDTGMHRLGFAPEDIPGAWQRLQDCNHVAPDIVLISHMANASDRGSTLVRRQLASFDAISGGLDACRSMANSAGILQWPDSHYDYVRPGLMLYGVSPMDDTRAADHGLRPVMSLESRLISVKGLKRGDAVGYGATWTCPEDMPVGIVAAGYGDGFPRHAGSGTPVMVGGVRSQIVGNASMDMLCVDLRPRPQSSVGDPVQLWGDQLPVEEVAKHAGTIPYELLCGVQPRLEVIEKNSE
jgi:alanine racemase